MFQGLVESVLSKARVTRSARYRLVCLVLDEVLFLLVVPWMLILPAWLLARRVPWDASRLVEYIVGSIALIAGLSYSLWAVSCQWRMGEGTPSLNAPTQRLVAAGPYRLSRNPIQFGALLYVLGLGTLCFSIATGILAFTAGFIVGIVYIKGVEEKELAVRFGTDYEEYKKRTPFLIPSLFRNRCERSSGELPDALPTKGRVLVHAAAVYDLVQPIVTLGQESRLNRWVAEQLPLEDGMNVLDVGCGTGLLTAAIAARHMTCAVEGVDASGPMVRVADRKRALPNCTFRQALGEDLPYPDGFFDVVTSALFFHHLDRELKRRCLAEIYRTLRPGGRLVIADMDRPYTVLGWMLSYGAWILFRQPEIKENIDGVLRDEVVHAGFDDMNELARFSGYITVLSARRPE
jgi:ubiquinone/menaquinone biosynthesis C-methylase UbiE/protein-S-isoprenylcysteine O-methyltransferase Ste14